MINKTATRNVAIDIAKGIGIICVVWGHLAQECPIRKEIFLFHMPFFFILSGYFFHDSQLRLLDVLKKNIKSYFIPYVTFFVVCLSIYISLYTVTGRASQIHINPWILIYPYGVVTPLWFLLSLFEVHLIYYLITHYIKKEIGVFLCVLACALIGYALSQESIKLHLYINASLSMVFFFYAGSLLKKQDAFHQSEKTQLLMSGAGVLLYGIGIGCNLIIDIKENIVGNNVLLFVFSAMGATYAIVYISKWLSKLKFISSFLSYLGQNTLSIFALHITCFEIARCLFNASSFGIPFLRGLYLLTFGIAGSLLIGNPIRKYILPYLTKTFIGQSKSIQKEQSNEMV